MAVSLQDESGYQQDSCEFYRKSEDRQDSCTVSRKRLDTCRIAVESLERV